MPTPCLQILTVHDRKLYSLVSNQRLDFKLHKGFQSETVRTLRVTAFSPDRLNNLSSALFFWRQVTTHRAVESNSTLVTGMFLKYRLTVWPISFVILLEKIVVDFCQEKLETKEQYSLYLWQIYLLFFDSVWTKLTNTEQTVQKWPKVCWVKYSRVKNFQVFG